MVMKSLNALLAEKFKDQDFEKKYHRTSALFRLADEVLLLRKKRGLTQKELATKVETTQAVVSRLENATVKPSMETILKIAEALNAVVDIRLVPIEEVRKTSEDVSESNAQKQTDPLEGIVYFHADEIKDEPQNWIKPETLSSLLSISGKPTLMPLSKPKKVRKFA